MRPRSSRSHCTFVPAASITASMPHVRAAAVAPRDDRERPVLAALGERAAACSPSTTSSIPPVPNVILASPGRTQPWPTSDACWSPTSAAIGGAPGSARRRADDAGGVDDRRHHRGRDAERRRAPSSSHAGRVAVLQAGDRGVRRVGDVHRAVRERPRDPRVDGAEAQVRGARRGRRAGRAATAASSPTGSGPTRTPSAAQREARADRAQVLPAEPGPDRLAGRAVPHDRRAALVGDADRVDRPAGGERGARELEARVGEQRARRTRRGRRRASRGGARVRGRRRTSRRRRTTRGAHAARADVDDEDPPGRSSLTARRPRRTGREPELAGVEDAVRVERVLHRLQHAEARRRAPRATKRARFRPTPW